MNLGWESTPLRIWIPLSPFFCTNFLDDKRRMPRNKAPHFLREIVLILSAQERKAFIVEGGREREREFCTKSRMNEVGRSPNKVLNEFSTSTEDSMQHRTFCLHRRFPRRKENFPCHLPSLLGTLRRGWGLKRFGKLPRWLPWNRYCPDTRKSATSTPALDGPSSVPRAKCSCIEILKIIVP